MGTRRWHTSDPVFQGEPPPRLMMPAQPTNGREQASPIFQTATFAFVPCSNGGRVRQWIEAKRISVFVALSKVVRRASDDPLRGIEVAQVATFSRYAKSLSDVVLWPLHAIEALKRGRGTAMGDRWSPVEWVVAPLTSSSVCNSARGFRTRLAGARGNDLVSRSVSRKGP
jgi:hypothetical protein